MPATQLPLVCLPFAGSGAGFYRAWNDIPAFGSMVVPVQLPGREEVFIEEPFTEVTAAAAGLTPRIVELVGEAQGFALFGHSLGAVLAYEIAHELDRRGHPGLTHVYVSGSPGPACVRENRATGLEDEAFLKRVREFAGYRHRALDNPELRELLLPTLRADVEMHENYQPSSTAPLRVSVTTLRGTDDTLVSREQADQWSEATKAEFRYVELPGGHMYLVDSPALLLRTITGN